MRYLGRVTLDAYAVKHLAKLTAKVEGNADPNAEAQRLWKQKKGKAWTLVRSALREMCSGRQRCMYCEDSRATDIEHFFPKADYPTRAFVWENYLYSCTKCNSNKSNDFPLDNQGGPLLIDPSSEDPFDHLDYSPGTGKYNPRGKTGTASCRVYDLNDPDLELGRQIDWDAAQAFIERYAAGRAKDDKDEMDKWERATRNLMSGVVSRLVRLAKTPLKRRISGECLQALEDCPEVATWFQPCQ